MKRAALIPHDQIACLPTVLKDQARLGRKRHQFVEESPTLRHRHPKMWDAWAAR
jgi:hypothetical protein